MTDSTLKHVKKKLKKQYKNFVKKYSSKIIYHSVLSDNINQTYINAEYQVFSPDVHFDNEFLFYESIIINFYHSMSSVSHSLTLDLTTDPKSLDNLYNFVVNLRSQYYKLHKEEIKPLRDLADCYYNMEKYNE